MRSGPCAGPLGSATRGRDVRGRTPIAAGLSAALSLVALLVLGSAVATDLRWAGAAIAVASSPATPPPAAETPAAGPATDGVILALLADGRLFAVDRPGERAIGEVKLFDPSSDLGQTPGHYIALGRDGTTLFALLVDESDPPGVSRLAAVDPVTLRLLTPNLLAGHDVTFRSLAVGPATGRLYLFGNRGRDAVVSVLDPAGRPLAE